jgi:protein phosphatase
VYFVGVNDEGFVTLYRGLPYSLPAGIDLYSENYVSGMPTATLSPKVRATVTKHNLRSRDDGADLVAQVEQGKLAGQAGATSP